MQKVYPGTKIRLIVERGEIHSSWDADLSPPLRLRSAPLKMTALAERHWCFRSEKILPGGYSGRGRGCVILLLWQKSPYFWQSAYF